jgi:hypothetical protein
MVGSGLGFLVGFFVGGDSVVVVVEVVDVVSVKNTLVQMLKVSFHPHDASREHFFLFNDWQPIAGGPVRETQLSNVESHLHVSSLEHCLLLLKDSQLDASMMDWLEGFAVGFAVGLFVGDFVWMCTEVQAPLCHLHELSLLHFF